MDGYQRVNERGWWISLTAPETASVDREGRLAQVESVLDALSPVLRPLAIEIELIWRELDTGLPSPIFPESPVRLLVLEGVQPRVAIRPSVAVTPPTLLLPHIDREAMAACLENGLPPNSSLIMDWWSIRSLAVAACAIAPPELIKLEQIGRPVWPFEPSWFAGPIGHRDFEVVPPAVMQFYAEERVRFRLIVYWSGWSCMDSEERGAIDTAVSRLQVNGWTTEHWE